MSIETQLAQQIAQVLARSSHGASGSLKSVETKADVIAENAVRDEESFYKSQVHTQHIADMQSARIQREKYARWVFMLVAVWIFALFIILIAQGACPVWRPFSDKVLVTLVSSMTINLIGTLYIVLKYIFRSDAKS